MNINNNWELALKLDHAMFRILAEQARYGFPFDKKLALKHISTLDKYINKIDKEVKPQLPLRMVIAETKKAGVYSYAAKPFLQRGGYSEQALKYLDKYKELPRDCIKGPFSRLGWVEFDLGSASQIKDYLLSQGWIPGEWNRSKLTGKRTSPKINEDDDFLGVTSNIGKLIAKRIKYRHRRGQLEGFVKRLRLDGRLSAEVSGLTPTARLKHKVVVNIPGGEFDEDGNWVGAIFGHEMREVFIASSGHVIVGCDIASCQLRMLCHYMGDDAYTDAVINGKKELGTDIHTVNKNIAGCRSRKDAKTLIYAILFGAGDKNLAAQLGCSVRMARKMRKRFMDGLPKLKRLIANLKKVWRARGYLIGLDGRKIFVRSEHMLLVYLLQSAEAICMKVATLYSDKWIRRMQLDAHMVAHMHDEFQFEVIDKDKEKVGELLEKSIVKAGEYLKLNVPMAGESIVGMSWADTH